jgi:hypothetical protein
MVPSGRGPSPPEDRSPHIVALPDRRPETFAAFAREHPAAATRALEALGSDERGRMIAEARGRDRMDLLLLCKDARKLVRALPAADLLITVKEIGDDAPDLVKWASARQVQILIDLDAWRGVRLDPRALEEWLEILHDAPGKLDEGVARLDAELLIWWLRRRIRVIKAEPDGSLPPEAPAGLTSIDGVYHLHALRTNDDLALVRALLLVARARDETHYWRLVEGVSHELDAELETSALRWRQSRLNDEGFPSFEDALPVYARLDQARFDPARYARAGGGPLPGAADGAGSEQSLPARPVPLEGSLLERAWEEGRREGGWEAVEEDLASLLNRVFVADQIDWDSPADARAILERASATLNLGLESAVAGAAGREAAGRAARLIREARLEAFFRLGFSRTLQVRDAALRLAPGEEPGWTILLDPPLVDAVSGARLKRPLLWTGLLGDPEPRLREFRNLSEIDLALRAMRRAASLRPLWDALSRAAVAGTLEEGAPRRRPVRLSGLALTLFAWHVLENERTLRPLPASKLADLQAALFSAAGPGCGKPTLRTDTAARLRDALELWLARLDAGARSDAEPFLEACLERLRAEIGPLDPASPDPRAVSALLLSRA